MGKTVLAAASFAKQKYFIDPEFAGLPDGIRQRYRQYVLLWHRI